MKTVVSISGPRRPDNYTFTAHGAVTAELIARGASAQTFDVRQLSLAFPGAPSIPNAGRLKSAAQPAADVVLATP
jgi:hypothetical protein